MRVSALALASACGSSTPAPEPAQIALTAPAAGADDVIVAQVAGRPVWGSCVAAQGAVLAQHGEPAATLHSRALRECVDFELLAQAAERRGLGLDPDVRSAVRTELVSRLVARDFEDKYRSFADFKGAFDAAIANSADRAHQREFRASAYFRVVIPDRASQDVDDRAHALADRIAATLADQTGLFASDLFASGAALAEGSQLKVDHNEVPLTVTEGLVPAYSQSLYAIPAVGRIGAVARTRIKNHPDAGGWDVILMTDLVPAKELTHDELVAEMFPELRRAYFGIWVNQIAKSLGLHVHVEPDQLSEGGS